MQNNSLTFDHTGKSLVNGRSALIEESELLRGGWVRQKSQKRIYQRLLATLNNMDEKNNILSEIKIKLSNLDSRNLAQISSEFEYQYLFSELTLNNREYIENVCEILKKLFDASQPGEIQQKYSTYISMLIDHEDTVIRSLVLCEVLRGMSDVLIVSELTENTSLLSAVIKRIVDDDLAVAKCAMLIIKEVGRKVDDLRTLYMCQLLPNFRKELFKNDVANFRIFEIVIDIAKSSNIGWRAVIDSGLLMELINILDNDDVLLQLNALEAMTELALTEEGIRYLEEQQVFQILIQKMEEVNLNPWAKLLIPGLMKFFGTVAQYRPHDIFSKYPIVVTALFDIIDNGDQDILGIAFDTLGHICTSVEGKYVMQTLGESMFCALRKIVEDIHKMPTALKIRDMVVSLCHQPFCDIRQAGFELLAVVASQRWGQEYIASCAGLTEFLLDRNAEAFKECKEAKYEVIKRLVQSEEFIFTAEIMQKFMQFLTEGPFFVETNTKVAVEGAL
ncbi:hypothetical protein KM043_017061 [Ampulex compressa]|nr:hypothetical protein KM043_017061 [Ampulex compressa]